MNTSLVINRCPDDEVLSAWMDDGLSDLEMSAIAAHVAFCPDCRLVVSRVNEQQDRRLIEVQRVDEWFVRIVLGLALIALALVFAS